MLFRQPDRLTAVAGFGHDLPFGSFLKHPAETVPHDRVVVSKKDSDESHVHPTGHPVRASFTEAESLAATFIVTTTRVPPETGISIASEPPCAWARSLMAIKPRPCPWLVLKPHPLSSTMSRSSFATVLIVTLQALAALCRATLFIAS